MNVKSLAMLRVNASTTKPVPDARKLVIRMIRVLTHSNALTVENVILHIARNAVFIKGSITFSQSECPGICPSFEARTISENSWTEDDELCWGCEGSDPEHISMYTD